MVLRQCDAFDKLLETVEVFRFEQKRGCDVTKALFKALFLDFYEMIVQESKKGAAEEIRRISADWLTLHENPLPVFVRRFLLFGI